MLPRNEFYTQQRKAIGGRTYVSKLLKVDPSTLSRRERGIVPVTEEMFLALAMLKSNHSNKEKTKA